MKFAALLVLAALASASPAVAASIPAQPPQQACVAFGSGASRVAAVVADPAECCSGRLQCSQFLSTTVVVRPARELRT